MRSYSFTSNVDLLTTSRKPSRGPARHPSPHQLLNPEPRVGAAPPPPHPTASGKTRSAESERPSVAPGRACSVDPQVLFYSKGSRGPLASSRPAWVPGEEDILSFLAIFSLFRALRSLTSSPSGSSRVGSVISGGWGGRVGSDKSLTVTPPPPGAPWGVG